MWQPSEIWLTLTFNGANYLLWLSLIGLAIGFWQKTIIFKPWTLLCICFFAVLALLTRYTDIIAKDTMRYHFPGWLPILLLIVAGLYAFIPTFDPWLGVLVLFWVIAGYIDAKEC